MSLFAKVFIVINQVLSLLLVFLMATLLGQKADYRSKSIEEKRREVAVVSETSRKRADFQIQVANLENLIRKKVKETNEETQKTSDLLDQIKTVDHTIDVHKKEITELERAKAVKEKVNTEVKTRQGQLDASKKASEADKSRAEGFLNDWTTKLQKMESELRRLKAQFDTPN